MKLRTRILLSFGGVIAILAFLGLAGNSGMKAVHDQTEHLGAFSLPALDVVYAIDVATSDYRAAQLEHIIAQDDASMQAAERELGRLSKRIAELIGSYRRDYTDNDQEKEQLDALGAL
jgi:methyl-accepting chemotaxis protein